MALQPVRGTHDILPDQNDQFRHIVDTARLSVGLFGFREISTPIFESTEVFHRSIGEATDIVSKEMYTFTDRGGDSVTLRPEGTAGVARAFVSEGLAQLLPLKFFYQGPMFRYERPQKGRLRQFHQIGIELLGVTTSQADVECIAAAHIVLKRLGLVNQTKLYLNSLADTDSRKAYREALVKYLKQFASKLSADSQKRLEVNPLRILDSKDSGDGELLKNAPLLQEHFNEPSKVFFQEVKSRLNDLAIEFVEDPQLVRGLDYYTHTVFEFKSSDLGAQDTVLAGGRYDGLISLMGGPQTPGVGWAAGIERLDLLTKQELLKNKPVSLVPFGDKAEVFCIKLAYDLRLEGFAVDMAYGGNLSKRMKKADSAGAVAAVIVGDDEIAKGVVMLKDLKAGSQGAVTIGDLKPKLRELGVTQITGN